MVCQKTGIASSEGCLTNLSSPWTYLTPCPVHHRDSLSCGRPWSHTASAPGCSMNCVPVGLRSHTDSRCPPVYTLTLPLSLWLQTEDSVKWFSLAFFKCQAPQTEIPADGEKFFSLFLREYCYSLLLHGKLCMKFSKSVKISHGKQMANLKLILFLSARKAFHTALQRRVYYSCAIFNTFFFEGYSFTGKLIRWWWWLLSTATQH